MEELTEKEVKILLKYEIPDDTIFLLRLSYCIFFDNIYLDGEYEIKTLQKVFKKFSNKYFFYFLLVLM